MIKESVKIVGGIAIAIAGGTLATILSGPISESAGNTVFSTVDKIAGHDVVVKKGLRKKTVNTKALRKKEAAKAAKKANKGGRR